MQQVDWAAGMMVTVTGMEPTYYRTVMMIKQSCSPVMAQGAMNHCRTRMVVSIPWTDRSQMQHGWLQHRARLEPASGHASSGADTGGVAVHGAMVQVC